MPLFNASLLIILTHKCTFYDFVDLVKKKSYVIITCGKNGRCYETTPSAKGYHIIILQIQIYTQISFMGTKTQNDTYDNLKCKLVDCYSHVIPTRNIIYLSNEQCTVFFILQGVQKCLYLFYTSSV